MTTPFLRSGVKNILRAVIHRAVIQLMFLIAGVFCLWAVKTLL
jgi:hypothetical protein